MAKGQQNPGGLVQYSLSVHAQFFALRVFCFFSLCHFCRAMTTAAVPTMIYRQDYASPAWLIDSVDLTFDLDAAKTRVLSRLQVRRNPAAAPADSAAPLVLVGEAISLARVMVNGQGCSFRTEDGDQRLILDKLPDACELEIFTLCKPAENTELSGLYATQGALLTQCEAEGFRRITYFLDRPDVMASYSVTLRADKAKYPVLLSNGNLQEQGDLDDGRHFARWQDPHKKPSYLFALVAGNLVCREQKIKARSGSEHLLQIYVQAGDLDKTEHAMDSLIASIAWDEARFGLSLDLERFMIVATSDFNMGAMENKGLNIFNTKYVLANPATATDEDFAAIESVIGHEYFHNWTGNRITCRDWFQLSLKEGLTVFRDQEFSQDMMGSASAAAVSRINDVRVLRMAQFSEDAGPMAHPVRPEQYQEINNFYTATVYDKGAEVVRMVQTLVEREGFRKGMDLYFARHDGQAVTCDDFAQCMADANPSSSLAQHLEAFKRWYAQAGTPRVASLGRWDAASQTYTLKLSQSCPATPNQTEKLPFVIPVRMGLLGADGSALPLQLEGESAAVGAERVLLLTEAEHYFTFVGVSQAPTLSLFRGFSAPIIHISPPNLPEQLLILQHDKDAFNRWEAAQQLMVQAALQAYGAADGAEPVMSAALLRALQSVLRDEGLDPALRTLVLTLPAESYLAEQVSQLDAQKLHRVREAMRAQLAQALHADWLAVFAAHSDTGAYAPTAQAAGRRALANLALAAICLQAVATGDAVWQGKTLQRFKDASNMTDRWGALLALAHSGSALSQGALDKFYQLYQQEALVVDKWFALQASLPEAAAAGSVLPQVKKLLQHPAFNLKNPNRARSLVFAYCANAAAFHRADAAGYVFWAEQVLALDSFNSQTAARLARMLERWSRLAEPQRSGAFEAISRVAAKSSLSRDVREVLERALAQA